MRLKIRFKHWICRRAPFLGYPAGMVLYPYMLFKRGPGEVTDRLFRHEMEHVYQVRREGWFKFYAKYLWYMLRHGYNDNPYEVQANAVEDDPLTPAERAILEAAKRRHTLETGERNALK